MRHRFPFLALVVFLGGWFSPFVSRCCAAQTSGSSSTTSAASPHKSTTAHSSHGKTSQSSAAAKKRKKKAISRRVRRVNRAFVASADLKPMASQLLQNRSRAAYAGVEGYARRHSTQDAGALAWLVLGYAHILDHDYAKAIDPLKRAKPQAGELGDYIAYLQALAYGGTGDGAHVVTTLQNFEKDYADSIFARDAYVVLANALIAENKLPDAVALLERHREPLRADVELALARASIRSGEVQKGAEALHRIYYGMPTSAEAEAAQADLSKLPASSVPPPTFSEKKIRADLLLQARHYSDVVPEYRALLSEASAADRPDLQVSLAVALHRSGHDKDAHDLLESITGASPEANARRIFSLEELARAKDDDAETIKQLDALRQAAPTSSWLDEGLLLAANMYLLNRDYDHAIDYYREIDQRFPTGKHAPYAHWKATWLSLRQARNDDAKKGFEEQISKYPSSSEVPAALYWRARLAEDDHDPGKARAYYLKLSDRFHSYYYAELARQRMSAQGAAIDPTPDPILEKIPPADVPSKLGENVSVPDDDLRVQKALLLQNGGMLDFAVRELQAAAPGGTTWVTSEVAHLYQDSGRYDRAIEAVKKTVPAYFSFDIDELPRSYWEALFPRPFWTDVKRYSLQNGLDPFLVASLIRQESEFNPGAISRANALGLMQLLPKTGRTVARELRIRRYSESQLLVPNVNLQLGTRHFRKLVDQYGGAVEYALAAYNAGDNRVQDWLNSGKYRDTAEFVESIPFSETREYVQAIMRNAMVYRKLYGHP